MLRSLESLEFLEGLLNGLAALKIAKSNRFAHSLIGHRHADIAGVVEAVEQIEPFDGATFTRIKMPTDQLILVGVRLFLDRIIENQHPVFALHCAGRCGGWQDYHA